MASSKRFKDTIACHVEMFSENMQVFVYKNNRIQSVSIPGEDAARLLVDLCYTQNIFRLQLGGDSIYLENFIEAIKEEEELSYSDQKKIEITITEE